MKPEPDFKQTCIKSILPHAYDIRTPVVNGALKSVYFVDFGYGKYVLKLNHRKLVAKNALLADIFRQNGISVPKINVTNHGHTWCETYKIIPGKTLYECVGAGISDDQIKIIYRDILAAFSKMTQIKPEKFMTADHWHIHDVARQNTSDTNNLFMGTITGIAVRCMNIGSDKDMGLYHCGITPKNIIVSDDDKFQGLVDMDEVAIANKNYAFATMAAKYQLLGLDVSELFDQYEQMTGDKLNRTRIIRQVNIINLGRNLLWRHRTRGSK